MSLDTKTILAIGASKGTGRAIALDLANSGHKVIAVARGEKDLADLAAQSDNIATEAMDASAEGAASELLAAHKPDIILQIGGIRPPMGKLSEFNWDNFCAPWQSDTKISFHLAQAALDGGLPEGGSMVAFASGAAINGSSMSGGYAGAKRMQNFILNYAQGEADARELGLTFTTLYPAQLIAGTSIAHDASTAYGEMMGKDSASFMAQWDAPLTPEKISGYVSSLVEKPQKGAFLLKGTDMVAFP